tara:strand:+ start:406 stop:621 length:216 start_codon:yes stop_codon:yes gene_type:complete
MKKITIIGFIFFGLLGNAYATSNWVTSNFIEGYNLYSPLECNEGDPTFKEINKDLNYRCGKADVFKFINLN